MGVTRKTQFNQGRLFSSMTLFMPSLSLFVENFSLWEAKVRYRQFSWSEIFKSDVVGGDAVEVVGRMLPSKCQTHCFERFPLGAAATVTPAWTGPWLRLDLGPGQYKSVGFTDVSN